MTQSGQHSGAASSDPIVIFHKDHTLDPAGVNAGAETATILLAREFAQQGFKIFVAAQLPAEFSKANSGKRSADGVIYIDLGETFDTKKVFDDLVSLHGLERYHLIVASRAQALLESRGRKEIISRLFISHEPTAVGLGMQPSIIGKIADKVICVSDAQRQKLIDAGCSGAATEVVPNGADLKIFRAGDPAKRDYTKMIFVGALVIDKGIRQVLEGFAIVKSRYPQVTLDVYGSAEMWGRQCCFDLEQAKAIPGVTFHGAAPQSVVAEAFQTAGMLVLPSIFFDSFPLTVVEAQVCGVPVLGSTRGGMREIIIDEKTGRLLDEIDSETVAKAMEQMLIVPGMLEQMSRAALELIRPKYSWTNTAQRLLEIMTAIAGNKTARPQIMTASSAEPPKVGVLTTWNQACGLATYAQHFIAKFENVELTIFGENVAAREIIGQDDARVQRVWTRNSQDFAELQAAILEEGIEVLHLNCHYRFFEPEPLRQFLSWCAQRGVKTISHIHTTFQMTMSLQVLAQRSDLIIVHTVQNRLEMLANGAAHDRVKVIEHGVEVLGSLTRADARRALGVAENVPLIVCFGFVQKHKGIQDVISAIPMLIPKFPQIQLAIVGGPMVDSESSIQYATALKQFVRNAGLNEHVKFLDQFVSEEMLSRFLKAADVVVMNYLSNYYEASGAVARALGAHAAIVASSAPTFARLEDTVFHLSEGYPMDIALEAVLSNPELKASLQERAAAWAKKYSWSNIVAQFESIYREQAGEARAVRSRRAVEVARPASQTPQVAARVLSNGPLKILMQNRKEAFTHRGGDTVVMERIAEELRRIGVQVDIDVEGQLEPRDYDLVHLFNFAMPEITEGYARKCVEQNVPYLVTCMYEDLPRFYHQMLIHFQALEAYIKANQHPDVWAPMLNAVKNVELSKRWENTWTAHHAAALIATGESEREVLKMDYPDTKKIELYRLGCDVTPNPQGPELFIRETGLKDFVLCVGRLETRKNQLMLMKALEYTDHTLVFVTGGFTYQPEYELACRTFRRKGKTIFLGRLSPEMLESAFAAAKVHALPSWYELPGIVSMEAARLGKNLVVTEYGTTRDYFGDEAFYCDPGEPESILQAVKTAMAAPTRVKLMQEVADCTWENAAKRTLEIYQGVLNDMENEKRTNYSLPEWQDPKTIDHVVRCIEAATKQATTATESVSLIPKVVTGTADRAAGEKRALELCEEADELLRQGQNDAAWQKYSQAVEAAPQLARPVRSLGVTCLMTQKLDQADDYFRRALRVDAADARSLAGLGAVEWGRGNQTKAFDLYLHAMQVNPNDSSTLLHFMNACYVLNRLTDLEDALLTFLQREPENVDIQYSLAGCYFKQDKLLLAGHAVARALQINPEHAPSVELKQIVDQKSAASLKTAASPMLGAAPSAPLATQVFGPEKTAQPEGSIIERFKPKFSNSVDERIRAMEAAKSRQDYQSVLEEAPGIIANQETSDEQRAHARLLRAEALACVGKLDEADQELRSLESVRAFQHRVLTDRGALAAARLNWTEAQNYFIRALEIFPDFDGALAGLGLCAMQQGDREMAWAYFNKSLETNPENMRALLGVVQLGYPLNRLSDVERAILNYLEIHPANLSVLYSHAGCCYAQGRLDEARGQLEKIRIFDPEHKLANELLEKINSDLGLTS